MYGYYDSTEPQPRSYLDGKTSARTRPIPVTARSTAPSTPWPSTTRSPPTRPPSPTCASATRASSTTACPCDFDPGTLGFASSFVTEVPEKKFPYFGIGSYGTDYNGRMFGDRPHQRHHLLLLGRQRLDVEAVGQAHRQVRRVLPQDRRQEHQLRPVQRRVLLRRPVHERRPAERRQHRPATRWRRSCSATRRAAPSPWPRRPTPSSTTTRGTPRTTSGSTPTSRSTSACATSSSRACRRRTTTFTVGFDRDRAWPVQVPGVTLKGGLMYAGVDGYPTHQSDPSKTKFAPRVGFAWSIEPQDGGARRLRPVLGAPPVRGPQQPPTWARAASPRSPTTSASTDGGLTPCATCNLANPFPSGIPQPSGSANGLLTGAGGTVEFVDQFRKSAYVHQYSLDFQRELPGNIVAGIGYIGAAHRSARGGRQRFRHREHQPARPASISPWARPCSSRSRTRSSATRPSAPSRTADDHPRPAPAALPAVRRPAGPPGERRARPAITRWS